MHSELRLWLLDFNQLYILWVNLKTCLIYNIHFYTKLWRTVAVEAVSSSSEIFKLYHLKKLTWIVTTGMNKANN